MRATVDALNALSVFGSEQEGAYREHSAAVRAALGDDIPTALCAHLVRWGSAGDDGAIILTGNAGTGKTALAQAFCSAVGGALPEDDVLAEVASGRFVVKDLSGVPARDRPVVIDLLEELRTRSRGGQLLVCANEGMLRESLAQRPAPDLEGAVDAALRRGLGRAESVLAINMNRQRWTDPLMWDRVLNYVTDERRWPECDVCAASPQCPLQRNAEALRNPAARETARLLVQLASGGAVVTLRELLATLAHAITGGISCNDVERAFSRGEPFDASSGYFNQMLGPSLRIDQVESSPLMMALRAAGVGDAADLEVDAWLRDASRAPSEVAALSGGPGPHGTVSSRVRHLTFAELGELLTISDDAAEVDACRADLAEGRNFLRLWRRRLFFEAGMLLGGRAAAFRRLTLFAFYGDLLDLVSAIRAGRSTADARAQIVKGLNFLAAGYHSYQGQLVVPDSGSLAARDPGSFRVPMPSLVHSEVAVERLRLELEEAEGIREFLDSDDVRVVLAVERQGQHDLELTLTPRLYQAIRDAADFKSPVGGDIPEMTELELFYSELSLAPTGSDLRVVDPLLEAIRSVTLPDLGDA